VAGVLLAGRWLDLHLAIGPANLPEHSGVTVWDVAGFVGLGALFFWRVTRAVEAVPLVPVGDPYLVESVHHHT
jgi:hypothetical protein